METGFIPPELLGICRQNVDEFHKKNGFDKLSARIAIARNLDALNSMPEALTILTNTNKYFNIRKWVFFGSMGIICFAYFIPWWSLSSIVVIYLADRVLAGRERDGWKSLASILLSLEMLSNDFSGWGTAYAEGKTEALRVLKDNVESPGSEWLDYYLPERTKFDPAVLKTFGPPQRSVLTTD